MSNRQRFLVLATMFTGVATGHAQPAPDAPTPDGPAEAPPDTPVVAPPSVPPTPTAPVSGRDGCLARRHEMAQQAQASADLGERARLLQALPDCDAPGASGTPSATTTIAPIVEPSALVTGFVLEARLETAQVLFDNNFALPSTQAGLFLGHRGRSMTVGIGLELGRITTSQSDGTNSNERSTTAFLLLPGLRGVLARSADDRTELLGQLDAGYGSSWQSSDAPGATDPPSITHLRLQFGPALRHWVTPTFAVGATAGLRYDRLSRSADAGTGSSDEAITISGLFSSLQVTGVF